MKEFFSTPLTTKGRVTVPIEVRKHLGIETNDKIAFVIGSDSIVRLRVLRYPNVASLRGAAGSLKTPLSWQEMQQIAYEDRFKARDTDFDRFDGITRQEP
jgi:bifunctional DNA-binding transcriptional regulator/antitoxin component of YhaV-PrlF toxin-antitoxin module